MAGELIVAAGAAVWPLVEIDALLTGSGTPFEIDVPGIRGLGNPPAKTSDSVLGGRDGSYAGPDYTSSRVLSIPYKIGGGTAADAMNDLATLMGAWTPAAADVELHFQLPGWGHFFVSGRPRGLDEDLVHLKSGEIAALATFHALDPTITFV